MQKSLTTSRMQSSCWVNCREQHLLILIERLYLIRVALRSSCAALRLRLP